MDLSALGISGTAALLLTGFVMGFVEMVKAFYDNEIRKGLIIVVAGVAGGAVAPFIGLSIITGIVGGFAASGMVTLAQNLGKTNTPMVE